MTNAYAKIGITYDAVDVQLADFQIFLQLIRGLDELPRVRGKDLVIPGAAGRTERNRINDTLVLELRGVVTADPAETDPVLAATSYRDNMTVVRNLFAADRAVAPLVALLEDATSRTIDARPMNIVIPRKLEGAYAELSIELEAYGDWINV